MESILSSLLIIAFMANFVLFAILYISLRKLFNYLEQQHPDLFDRFGGMGIFFTRRMFATDFSHRAYGATQNNNIEFFRFIFSDEYKSQQDSELVQQCNKVLKLFYLFIVMFVLSAGSMVIMALIFSK